MKKILLIIVTLTGTIQIFAQETYTKPVLTKQDLLTKSKDQRTGGWVLLGAGAGLSIGGVALMVDGLNEDFFSENNKADSKSTTGAVMFVAGIFAMGGSIPLLIASHRNHKKAMLMALKTEHIPLIQKTSWSYQSYPAISFSIPLGRR